MGEAKILQTYNGSEYKNSLLNEFCLSKNIQHIFSSPNHPKSNEVVEVSHKEIRKNVMIYYGEYPSNIDLNNAILNVIDIHNNNIHTVTNYKPCELINNSKEEVFNIVLDNIKKFNNNKKENYVELKEGSHVLIKKDCVKSGKRLLNRKYKIRDKNIIGTITNNYGYGVYSI